MILQDRDLFRTAYSLTESQINYMKTEFETMQSMLEDDDTPGEGTAKTLFDTVSEYLSNLETSTAGRFGTLAMGVEYFSSN